MNKITSLCLSLLTAMAVMAQDWTIVTDASDLKAGDQIVLACNTEGATAGAYDPSKGIFESVTSSFANKNDNITSLGAGTVIFTLGGQQGAWTISYDGNLIGANASKKLLLGNGITTWTISIISGDATIANTNANCGAIQFNKLNPRFLNYTSTQTPVQIYRGAAVPEVSISYEGFPYKRTMCDIPTYAAGSVISLPSATPEKDGKQLTAWQFEGKTYQPGADFEVPEKDVVFVPVWGEGNGVEQTPVPVKAVKIIRDGQLFILRDGILYNAQGARAN